MSASEYLKGLPSYNENNFARFQADSTCKVLGKRPFVYVSTKDYPQQQIIITEKTNILLRYLTKSLEKKHSPSKKQGNKRTGAEGGSEGGKKRFRLDPH